jgi:16S rRNA (cytosine967-C5)-methyltransferase
MKKLYAEIAEVKEPFDRDNLWRMFAVWAGLSIQIGATRRNT